MGFLWEMIKAFQNDTGLKVAQLYKYTKIPKVYTFMGRLL